MMPSSGPGTGSSSPSASSARRPAWPHRHPRSPSDPAATPCGRASAPAQRPWPLAVPARMRANNSSTEGPPAAPPSSPSPSSPSPSRAAPDSCSVPPAHLPRHSPPPRLRRRRVRPRCRRRPLVPAGGIGRLTAIAAARAASSVWSSWARIVVHPVARTLHRCRHLVAGRSQCLDLHPERAPPPGQVGQHSATRLLDLVEQCPALVLGPGDELPLPRSPRRRGCARSPRAPPAGRWPRGVRLRPPARPSLPPTSPGARSLCSASHAARWPPLLGPAPRCAPPLRGRAAGSARCAAPATPSGSLRPPPGAPPAPRPRPERSAAPARAPRAPRGYGPPTGGRRGPRRCRTPAGPRRRSGGRCRRWRSGTRRWGHGLLPWCRAYGAAWAGPDWSAPCSAPCRLGA